MAEGFGEDLNGKADAVFLDLPSPWTGVKHAVDAMKNEGKNIKPISKNNKFETYVAL